MKSILKENDPKLTAYAFDELTREESAQIAQELKSNPALQKEVHEIDSLGIALSQAFGKSDELKLSAKQRSTIFESGRKPTVEDVISTHKKQWLRPVIVTLSAAAVLTLTFTVLNNMAGRDDISNRVSFDKIDQADLVSPVVQNQSRWKKNSENNGTSAVSSNHFLFDSESKKNVENMDQGLMHHPDELRSEIEKTANTTNSPLSNQFVEISENNWENRAEKAMSRVPLVSGNSSWKWLEQWANDTNSNTTKPNKHSVRIEEILNHFNHSKPADIQIGNIHTGVTLVQCPWNPAHQVAVILVQNRSQADSYAEAAVSMSESVSKYRLLGYANSTQPGIAKIAPTRVKISPNYSHLVMYEIALTPNTQLGDDILHLTVNAESAHNQGSVASNSLSVQHSNLPWDRSPQDVQFSLVLTSWAQFLSNSKFNGSMDASKIKNMIQNFQANHKANAKQQSALSLISRSIQKL